MQRFISIRAISSALCLGLCAAGLCGEEPASSASSDPIVQFFHAALRMAEADLAKAQEANKTMPGAFEPSEVRRLALAVERARAELAKVEGNRALVDLPTTAKEREAAIRKVLDEETEFHFLETPLEAAAALLAKKHRIDIQIDKQALDDAGLGTDTPVSNSQAGIRLRSALRLLLKEFDLTWVIDNDGVLITTVDEASQQLTRQGYEVSDLVIVGDRIDYGPLIDTIYGIVAPRTWDKVGGPATLATQHRLLVISQTAEVHEEIAALLAEIRRVRKGRADKVEAKQAVREVPRPPTDPYFISVKIYKVGVPPRYLDGLVRTIPELVHPESWERSGGQGVLYALPADGDSMGYLLVRQTAEVHAQLQKALQELRPDGQ